MDLLALAKTSKDQKVLTRLADSNNYLIRRAVAGNSFTTADTLRLLANDPVLNVTYVAYQNPKCPLTKDLSDISHPCVICKKDERDMECTHCATLSSYKLAS